jgi:hypothetical protein
MSDTNDDQDLARLTTVPVLALAQPLIDFLGSNGVTAFTIEDDTGLDAGRSVEVVVAAADEAKAKALLADFWAANEGPSDVM